MDEEEKKAVDDAGDRGPDFRQALFDALSPDDQAKAARLLGMTLRQIACRIQHPWRGPG